MAQDQRQLYETDHVAWTSAQAAALRDLIDDGEDDLARAIPADSAHGLALLLDESWYPVNRHGLADRQDPDRAPWP